jgi:thiol-disulfide isomerase/thioredoxin
MADGATGPARSGRRELLALAAALLLRPGAVGAADSPPTELPLLASDGKPVLAAGPGRATYVDFWASWCTPCRLSFPWMNEMHDRYAARGLRIVAIGLDRQAADAQRFLQRTQPRFAIALDPAADSARRLDVQAMPSSYLFSAERRLLFSHRGFRLEDGAALEHRLLAALA